jgi:hypothetical protein
MCAICCLGATSSLWSTSPSEHQALLQALREKQADRVEELIRAPAAANHTVSVPANHASIT